MSDTVDEWEDYEPDDDAWDCVRCGGSGEIMWCPDDICRGSDECIHGDGMMACPTCKGSGYIPDPAATQEDRDGRA